MQPDVDADSIVVCENRAKKQIGTIGFFNFNDAVLDLNKRR